MVHVDARNRQRNCADKIDCVGALFCNQIPLSHYLVSRMLRISSALLVAVCCFALVSVAVANKPHHSHHAHAKPVPTITPFYSWTSTINTTFLQAGYPLQYSLGQQSWQLDSQYNRSAWFGNQGVNFVADYDNAVIWVLNYYRNCSCFCKFWEEPLPRRPSWCGRLPNRLFASPADIFLAQAR